MGETTEHLLDGQSWRLPERLVAVAQALTGGPAALYVLDIGGTSLRLIAGQIRLPAVIPLVSGVGPELGRTGLTELRARLEQVMSGAVAAPLWLRGRAMCVLVATGGKRAELEQLAAVAAPAVELACSYTDVFARARRHRPATAAAEMQQDLLPPRIASLSGGEIAASLMPAYDVGGDWFDHAENPEGAWLGVADAVGRGTNAAAISAVAIGAFRAARRARRQLEECCGEMADAVGSLGESAFVTAVIATWQVETRTFAWVNCGHPWPILIRRGGGASELAGHSTLPLGLSLGQPAGFQRNERRLEVGDRVLLYSDGVTDQRRSDGGILGLDSLLELLGAGGERSADETVIAIAEHMRAHGPAKLADDATIMVLAVTS